MLHSLSLVITIIFFIFTIILIYCIVNFPIQSIFIIGFGSSFIATYRLIYLFLKKYHP
jgi:hypothetical protein